MDFENLFFSHEGNFKHYNHYTTNTGFRDSPLEFTVQVEARKCALVILRDTVFINITMKQTLLIY